MTENGISVTENNQDNGATYTPNRSFTQIRNDFIAYSSDTNPDIMHMENQLTHNLREVTEGGTGDEYGAILYSRIKNSWFYWPKDASLNIQTMSAFANFGHTLSIDMRLSYKRMAAWDFNCGCRKMSNCIIRPRCITPQDALLLCRHIIKFLKTEHKKTIGKQIDIKWQLQHLDCGFHLYTDFPISLPTHLHITSDIIKTYSGANICIQVPALMPLPFSCKTPPKVYQRYDGNESFELLSCGSKVFEMFEYTPNLSNHRLITKITSLVGTNYMYQKDIAIMSPMVPNFPTFHEMSLHTVDYLRPLIDFIIFTKSHVRYDTLTNENVIIDDPHFQEFSIEYNRIYRMEDSSWKLFIEHSLRKCDSLYLQHYVVALHKYILERDRELTYDTFRMRLQQIYVNHLYRPIIMTFINKYDHSTFSCYSDTPYEEMIMYFQIVNIHELKPEMTINEIITKYMSDRLGSPVEQYCNAMCEIKKSSAQSPLIDGFVQVYIDMIKKFKFIISNGDNLCYEYNDSGGNYRRTTNSKDLPGLKSFIADKHLYTRIANKIWASHCQFKTSGGWTDADFMIATSLGLFNCVTGLYSAHVPFIRLSNTRLRVLFPRRGERNSPKGANDIIYPQMNDDIEALSRQSDRFIENFQYINTFYAKFIVMPALISIWSVGHVDEFTIELLLRRLHNMEDLDDLQPILNYYQLEPCFVAVIINVLRTTELDMWYSAQALSKFLLNTTHFVTADTWRKHFERFLDETSLYDQNSTAEKRTLIDLIVDNVPVSMKELIVATILGTCMMYCKTFSTFVNAFTTTPIQIKYDNNDLDKYPYPIDMNATVGCIQENLQRAIRSTFHVTDDDFEYGLLKVSIKLMMSCGFYVSKFEDLMNAFSNICTTNNKNKKMFVLFGPKNVGKSYTTDLLEPMTESGYLRLANMAEANERSAVTSTSNLVVLNEVNNAKSTDLKTVTGADQVSAKIFHSQEYQTFRTQALVIGSTNEYIKFYDNCISAEQTTIDRLHAVHLVGSQQQSSASDRLISLMVRNTFIMSTVNSTKTDDAYYLSWLLYSWYWKNKHPITNFPPLNNDSIDATNYREQVYRKNNRLYRFITSCGISEIKDTYMSYDLFLHRITENIKESNKYYKQLSEFFADYNAHYKFNESEKLVPNLIETNQYEHMMKMIEVIPAQDKFITQEEIAERSNNYLPDSYKSLMCSLFNSKNIKYYNPITRNYDGVEFKYENETNNFNIDYNITTNKADSFVSNMKLH